MSTYSKECNGIIMLAEEGQIWQINFGLDKHPRYFTIVKIEHDRACWQYCDEFGRTSGRGVHVDVEFLEADLDRHRYLLVDSGNYEERLLSRMQEIYLSIYV